jgi:hypothetical protein
LFTSVFEKEWMGSWLIEIKLLFNFDL